MPTKSTRWGIRFAILVFTCFGVFVLPFLFPPPYFESVSASNLAGFNNRVAALAAAGMGTLVFFLALRWPQLIGTPGRTSARREQQLPDQRGRLSRWLVAVVALLWGGAILLFGLQIIRLGMGYTHDWGYFINQISMYSDFGRKLYTQIEFSYGPLLFYGPVVVKSILSPFHLSESGAYLATLVIEIIIGLLLVAYVIDNLPITRQWKAVVFSLYSVGMFVGNMGLNHTFFRFVPPMAFLMMASQRRRPQAAALWIFAGEAICLGLSPEIGFALFVGSLAFTGYRFFTQGKIWLWGVAASVLSVVIFLLIAGRPYLRMLGMFSHGVFNFPVEPLPHILLLLFALVWLVPTNLATFFRQQRPEAPMLAAFYLMSVALLPAAFGRADPGHVFWNGLSLFLLSVVAVSSKRMWQQVAWGGCLALMILWMCNINRRVNWFQLRPVLRSEAIFLRDIAEGRRPVAASPDEEGFSLQTLQAIVGHDPVATPDEIPLPVQKALRESGQYTPSFYDFSMSLLDADAENRQVLEFNQSKWALIPVGESYGYVERPEDLKLVLGFQLPYRTRRPIFAVGLHFAQNLAEHWRVRGRVGNFLVYEHM